MCEVETCGRGFRETWEHGVPCASHLVLLISSTRSNDSTAWLPPRRRPTQGGEASSVCAGSDLDSPVGTLCQGRSDCLSRLYTAQPGVGMAPLGVVLGAGPPP